MASIVQSVIFDTTHWSVLESARWLLDHDYKVKKIEKDFREAADKLEK
jgi:hypothetical protein